MASNQMVCLDDFERYALANIHREFVHYLHDGTEDQVTFKDNREAFKRHRLLPRVLRNVSSVDMATSILGHKISFPVCVAPSAMQKLVHPDGEIAAMRACRDLQTLYTMGTYSTSSMAEVRAVPGDPLLFLQLYVVKETRPERPWLRQLLREAERGPFKALVLTVDTAVVSLKREHSRKIFDLPRHLSLPLLDSAAEKGSGPFDVMLEDTMDWKFVTWLKSVTHLPVILKGIMTARDAELAVEHGVAAVWVSNHGGRQQDTVPATIDVLESVVRAVCGRCEVYMDGGVRSGTDVFKALALGARAVFIGRPVLHGLAYDGYNGVKQVLSILKDELSTAMALCGCTKVSEITRDIVVHESQYSKL